MQHAIVLALDGLSPSFLGPYGNTWLETPAFNKLADESILAQQMLAEFRNMHAHGLDNPNIYDGPAVKDNGDLDFSKLDRILDLREAEPGRSRTATILRGRPHLTY